MKDKLLELNEFLRVIKGDMETYERMYSDYHTQNIKNLKYFLETEIRPILERAIHGDVPEPDKKPVDLSVFIDSGIDCEFCDFEDFSEYPIVRQLKKINDGASNFIDCSGASWRYCRPRMNYVYAWTGGECPLPEGLLFNIYLRCRDKHLIKSDKLKWNHEGKDGDIIAFEIGGLMDGYCWSWEV